MWVKLRAIKYLRVSGVMTTYRAGEWVSVSKALAKRWIEEGSAVAAKITGMARIMKDSGVVVLGNLEVARAVLNPYEDQLEIVHAEAPVLSFPRTLLWCPELPIRLNLMAVGFGLLDTWQVAASLLGYEPEQLAVAQGTAAEREHTLEVIRDLRVPCYDPRMLFVRRCNDTQRFMETWAEERDKGNDPHLAFHRALYRCKPRLWPLPTSWTEA